MSFKAMLLKILSSTFSETSLHTDFYATKATSIFMSDIHVEFRSPAMPATAKAHLIHQAVIRFSRIPQRAMWGKVLSREQN